MHTTCNQIIYYLNRLYSSLVKQKSTTEIPSEGKSSEIFSLVTIWIHPQIPGIIVMVCL